MSGGTARVLLPRLRTRARRASWRRPRTHSGVIVKDRRRDDLLRTLKGRAHTAVQVTLRGQFTAAVERIRLPRAPYAIGCVALRTFLVRHPRLGLVKISQRAFVPECDEIQAAFDAGGVQLFDGDDSSITHTP